MSKKDIVKYIIDEYGVTSPTDITNALKDLLGETLQDMLNSEFDEHMGYDKYDQKKLIIVMELPKKQLKHLKEI